MSNLPILGTSEISSFKCPAHCGHSFHGAVHQRLNRIRGSATAQQCVRCPSQARDWAQVHTEDGSDIWSDYVPLCRRCHHTYDERGKCVAASNRRRTGYTHTAETKAKMSAARTLYWQRKRGHAR